MIEFQFWPKTGNLAVKILSNFHRIPSFKRLFCGIVVDVVGFFCLRLPTYLLSYCIYSYFMSLFYLSRYLYLFLVYFPLCPYLCRFNNFDHIVSMHWCFLPSSAYILFSHTHFISIYSNLNKCVPPFLAYFLSLFYLPRCSFNNFHPFHSLSSLHDLVSMCWCWFLRFSFLRFSVTPFFCCPTFAARSWRHFQLSCRVTVSCKTLYPTSQRVSFTSLYLRPHFPCGKFGKNRFEF